MWYIRFYSQWMVVGVRGANGTHALKRVALDHNTAVGSAITQLQHTEGNIVQERVKRPGTATRIPAQVFNSIVKYTSIQSSFLASSKGQFKVEFPVSKPNDIISCLFLKWYCAAFQQTSISQCSSVPISNLRGGQGTRDFNYLWRAKFYRRIICLPMALSKQK